MESIEKSAPLKVSNDSKHFLQETLLNTIEFDAEIVLK